MGAAVRYRGHEPSLVMNAVFHFSYRFYLIRRLECISFPLQGAQPMTVQVLQYRQIPSLTQWLRNALLSLCMATPLALAAPEGVTQVDLGKAKVSMINDGVYARPLDEKFVTNAPLEQVTQALRDVGLPDDQIGRASCRERG